MTKLPVLGGGFLAAVEKAIQGLRPGMAIIVGEGVPSLSYLDPSTGSPVEEWFTSVESARLRALSLGLVAWQVCRAQVVNGSLVY